jgi:chromosome partitioning protein
MMTRSIAFHSYKGGTGKSTIAANLAASLARQGNNVSLLDLDVYAPSLQVYFDQKPEAWINDLLSDNARLSDVMVDMTSTIETFALGLNNRNGKLWIGFSNPKKEEIYKLDGSIGKQKDSKIQLRKFIQLREDLISEYNSDYIIIDTSPGIRYWSINSLALADIIFLTLKFGDLDIEGTKKMATDMYDSFTKFGAKSYLLLNRVAGYCVPNVISENVHVHEHETLVMSQGSESDLGTALSKEVQMELMSAVPCYCDIQFSRKEFLTVLRYPTHPFAKQLERLAESERIKND